jgi:CheY-like chemotaxis protein
MQTTPDDIEQVLSTPEDAAAGRQPAGSSGRVLVAEDARCVGTVLAAKLERMHLQVDLAKDGEIACTMAMRSRESGAPYDAILMDMQMPKRNGKEATRWLRNNGWEGIIIAVSLFSRDKDHAEFLAAGCDECLNKPVSEASLQHVLSKYLTPA